MSLLSIKSSSRNQEGSGGQKINPKTFEQNAFSETHNYNECRDFSVAPVDIKILMMTGSRS